MTDNLGLLEKQLEVNNQRIKKLEQHKESIETGLKNPKSEKDYERFKETMKRLEKNLKFEYKQHDEIIKAISSKVEF